jgi:conjugative transfer signal peptidase TraF
MVVTFQMCGWLGIRINTSPSLPLGLYIVTSNAGANLVEFCPVQPFASLAILRGYRDQGACQDGGSPLLKPIVAKPGDLVQFSERGISVNSKLLPNTEPLTKDTKGRTLKSWPFGRYAVQPGSVWVGSSYNRRSFDSRYFGPIPTNTIRKHLRPLLTQW